MGTMRFSIFVRRSGDQQDFTIDAQSQFCRQIHEATDKFSLIEVLLGFGKAVERAVQFNLDGDQDGRLR